VEVSGEERRIDDMNVLKREAFKVSVSERALNGDAVDLAARTKTQVLLQRQIGRKARWGWTLASSTLHPREPKSAESRRKERWPIRIILRRFRGSLDAVGRLKSVTGVAHGRAIDEQEAFERISSVVPVLNGRSAGMSSIDSSGQPRALSLVALTRS